MKIPFNWFNSQNSNLSGFDDLQKNFEESFLEAGRLLRERREHFGISLRELSVATRITTPVIEAIERGWIDRLPENAYLSSMLPRLEITLQLREGSLSEFLKYSQDDHSHKTSFIKFTPGSIDILSSWQGNFVYILVMALSLFTINYTQRNIRLSYNSSGEIIPINLNNIDSSNINQNRILALKGTRPLDDLQIKDSRAWFGFALENLKYKANRGVLKIILKTPRRLIITPSGDEQTSLVGVKGTLSMRIIPPFVLEIIPPPLIEDKVTWQGKTFSPQEGRPGFYVIEQLENN